MASDGFSTYNSTAALATLAPDEIALRLRGRAVGSADELAGLLRYEMHKTKPDEIPVAADVFDCMCEWFSALIRQFDSEQLATFLNFATARRNFRSAPDEAREAPSLDLE